jgi:hypothetical protein
LKVIIVLVTAMHQGPTPRSLGELHRLFGAGRRTIARWQTWWQEIFPRTLFWKQAQARFMPPLRQGSLLGELVRVFQVTTHFEKLLSLLRFLSPITTGSGLTLQPS